MISIIFASKKALNTRLAGKRACQVTKVQVISIIRPCSTLGPIIVDHSTEQVNNLICLGVSYSVASPVEVNN